jgi:hypothetical protein
MAFLGDGFAERAKEVRDLMRSSSTSFVLVSSADSVGIEAARSVADEVAGRDFEIAHLVFNRAFIPEIGPADHRSATYPHSLAALAPKLERMRVLLTREQEQKHSNMVAFCKDQMVPAWCLPEATRPLGDTSVLAAWIEQARPIWPLA